MRRSPAALLLALCGCAFAQRHPAVTAGLVGGVVGYGTCAMDGPKASTCAVIGGSAALFLGGIVAIVELVADTSAHQLPPDDGGPQLLPNGAVLIHSHPALPPGAIVPPPGTPSLAPPQPPAATAPDAGAPPATPDAAAPPATPDAAPPPVTPDAAPPPVTPDAGP